ncbi:MAG: AAA family ATPase [Eubacteriales bacterium]
MKKYFNTQGICNPTEHYMVNLETRLEEIKELIDRKQYFTINRARQYGKTTTLTALEKYLRNEYVVVSLDFQSFGNENFQSESIFTSAFVKALLGKSIDFPDVVQKKLRQYMYEKNNRLFDLFVILSEWCKESEKPIVLMIDEVDSATNNQVFLDFLAQLRYHYLQRQKGEGLTFHAVVLAGVYDIKNITLKIHPDRPMKTNSPWNIATNFDVTMSFCEMDIIRMLYEYENDHHLGMDVTEIAKLIYEYTSGYPFLVSCICKLLDEVVSKRVEDKKAAWTKVGFLQAIKILLEENNTLFSSLIHKITTIESLRNLIYSLLFSGQSIYYNPDDELVAVLIMFGFAKVDLEGKVIIANRIFEVRLYNYFIAKEMQNDIIKISLVKEKNQFVQNGQLNMELILEKFVEYFTEVYGNSSDSFVEEQGRKYFLLFLKPIINGVGNYYIESQTRDMKRTDVIIDYLGKQYVVEMKIWHGEEYNKRGEVQLLDYLDYYRLQDGYMLSFNFNKNKQIGLKCVEINGKKIMEAVV